MSASPIPIRPGEAMKWVAICLVALILVVGLFIGGCSGVNSWKRSQKRADANNAVKVTSINIRKAQQAARITAANDAHVKALADQRLIEAVGIRRAQDEISKTLTPLYLQHEAIQAQERTAQSGRNNTIIYTPSGNNGVPIVQQPPLRPQDQLGGK